MKSPFGIVLMLLGACGCSLIVQGAPTDSPPKNPTLESGAEPAARALPAGYKASLRFARTRVAAGAISQPAHQSEFWIEVRDAQGQPRSGVAVALPTITRGGQTGQTDEQKAAKLPTKMSARLEWLATTKRVPAVAGKPDPNLALTGKDGRAYGRFTSGQRLQKVEFSVIGGAKGSIEQVWNEEPQPWNDADIGVDEPTLVRFEMSFKEGAEKRMIVGHHLELDITSIRFDALRLTGKTDEEGNPETANESETITVEEPKSAPNSPEYAQEKARWDEVMSWCPLRQMQETKDGIYEGYYQIKFPAEPMFWGGYQLVGVDNVKYSVWDNDAYEDG